MRRLMHCLLLLSVLCSCGSVTFKTSLPPDTANSYNEYFNFWALAFGSANVDLHQACPDDRIASIRNYMSGEDVAISIVTSGIYTPRTTKIVCAKGDRHAATP